MAKQKPKFRLSISRKDKAEIKYTDYKGDEVSKKYRPIGAVFYNSEDDRYFIASDTAFKYDPDTMWLNVFPVEEDDDDKPSKKAKSSDKGKPAKKVKKAAPPPEEDEDERDPFESDD